MTGHVEPRDLHALDCDVWTTHRGDCSCRDVDGQTAADRARFDLAYQAGVDGLIAAFERSARRGRA